ncbi:MAG: alpha-glucan family phosphorylase [SAR324 cluster bacterium]
MHGTPFTFDIRPQIPRQLERLPELANNLWYSWNRPSRALFARLHPALWAATDHSPRAFLHAVDQKRLDDAAKDPLYLSAYSRALSEYEAYHSGVPGANHMPHLEEGDLVAYFCCEFGLHESLPIYSGGLGILAGDHCKTASDAKLPFVGVGLLYRQGYFYQTIDREGRQHALYVDRDFDLLPATPVVRGDGGDMRIAVGLPGRIVHAKVWQVRVGHVSLYLLDTDIPENGQRERDITHRLYGGDNTTRLEQELVLGIGGARALAELGIHPAVWHVNEGHAAFLMVERVRMLVGQGLDFPAALEAVAANTVFTTHTAVPAGHDHFPEEAVRTYIAAACPELAKSLDLVLALGRSGSTHDFNMTNLAVRTSRHQNGVSEIHGGVSSRICADLWPQIDPEENPIGCITNGVHVQTFLAEEWTDLFERHLGHGWSNRLTDKEYWEGVNSIPDAQFWNVRQTLKTHMLHLIRNRIAAQMTRTQGSEAHLDRMLRLADPANPNVLTIGFARRFATYKRATLLFTDLDWLRTLVQDAKRPVLFIFAGKAHPADQPAQGFIYRIAEIARMPEFESKVLLLEGYDLRMARRLVSGVDVWLNNPVYPQEASGTSGIKAAINGVVNLSILDGWWGEGYDGTNGWAIKPASDALDERLRDEEEARTLLELLQDQVIPLYYSIGPLGFSPGWIEKAKASISTLLPRFSSMRMLSEYIGEFYGPAARQWKRYSQREFSTARDLAKWKAKVRAAWGGVSLRRLADPRAMMNRGESVQIAIAVKLNGLDPADVQVEMLMARPAHGALKEDLPHATLRSDRAMPETGEHVYALDWTPDVSGKIECRFRAFPYSEALTHPFEMGMMTWL